MTDGNAKPIVRIQCFLIDNARDNMCLFFFQILSGQEHIDVHVGNSSVTDIPFQRFVSISGACFIYFQSVNLKSFKTITK